MESNAFGGGHLPSQALVVLSEAASGLHEALRGQRPFPTRLPDAKDFHNMSLVGSYGTHLLHSFHPHLLQSLNHGMLAANGGAASYFANDRVGGGGGGIGGGAGGIGTGGISLVKPSLSNFQLPSAFSPPKYIGISIDQNLFNGSDSFRTDSASPTCTSHESMEGSNDYDADKGESPRSNNSDPRDLRHVHNKPTTSATTTTAATPTTGHQQQHQHQHQQHQHQHQHHQQHQQHHQQHHPHHHHHHHLNGNLVSGGGMGRESSSTSGMGALSVGGGGGGVAASGAGLSGSGISASCSGMRSLASGLGGLTMGGVSLGHVGLSSSHGIATDTCPICGIKLTAEEWNSHFLTELDRLYKLSAGLERPSLQASYMFAPPCPAQENAIRSSHNRWESFQRVRNNRQNRLRVKVRKRKYGNEMYFLDNLFCSSCPICKRKYALETGKLPPEDENKLPQDEIETVDVESCNDDIPDSGSELHHNHNSTGASTASSNGSSSSGTLSGGNVSASNMHNNSIQPGKLDGILYRTACVINSSTGTNTNNNNNNAASTTITTSGTNKVDITEDEVVTTNTTSNSSSSSACNWDSHIGPTTTSTAIAAAATTTTQGHISVKNVSELSSTTHHFYTADSCVGDERLVNGKDIDMSIIGSNNNNNNNNNSNESDEDVIVDDDDSIRITINARKRKYEETIISSRSSENLSPSEDRPRSEPQVTSTEPNIEISLNNCNNNHNNSNNNNNNITSNLSSNQSNKYQIFDDPRTKQHIEIQQQQQQQQHQHHQLQRQATPDNGTGLTHLDSKTGLKEFSSDFFRGRNFYFHQSCANVMSSYRLSKDLQQQTQQQQQQQQQNHQQQQQQQQQDLRKSPNDSGTN